jgi:hypothetical protein
MVKTTGLGSSQFARRYYGNRFFFLFLQLLRCFSSLRSLAPPYLIQVAVLRVAPFGNLRIKACFQLPEAYRR